MICSRLARPRLLLPGLFSVSALFITLLTVHLPVHAETALARIARTGNVVIGYRESSLPFSYLDENKRPVGYAIDLCRRLVGAIGKQLKRELTVEYRMVTSANRIEAVAGGQVDLECGSTTNNAERRRQVAFTMPHFITSTRFMVSSASGIASHHDLHHKRIVTTRGTTAEMLFPELNLLSELVAAPDHAAAFAMLESGRADAFLMDDILLASLRANSRQPERYRILDKSYRIEALAIMLGRDDPEFKAVVDTEMTRIILSGEINGLYRKWFEQPIPPHGINLHLPMSRLLHNAFRYPSDWAPD